MILIVCWANNLSAQSKKTYSRSSIILMGGINIPQVSVRANPGSVITLGYQFVPLKPFTLSAEVSFGTMSGSGPFKLRDTEGVIRDVDHTFSTQYVSYELTGMINLQRLFIGNRAPKKRLIPYLTVGAGYMNTSATRSRNNLQTTYDFTFYYNHMGGLVRIKTTKEVDLIVAARYNFTQTYFLDAIPMYDKYDNFLTFQAGVSLKLGVNKKRDFIDWKRLSRYGSKGNICPRFF